MWKNISGNTINRPNEDKDLVNYSRCKYIP